MKPVALPATSQAGSEIISPSNWGFTKSRFAFNDGFSSAHKKEDKTQDKPNTMNDANKGFLAFNKLPLTSTHPPDWIDGTAEKGTLEMAPDL